MQAVYHPNSSHVPAATSTKQTEMNVSHDCWTHNVCNPSGLNLQSCKKI